MLSPPPLLLHLEEVLLTSSPPSEYVIGFANVCYSPCARGFTDNFILDVMLILLVDLAGLTDI